MMPFAVATPVTEVVKRAQRKTIDLEEGPAEKASFLRVEIESEPPKTCETVTRQTTRYCSIYLV